MSNNDATIPADGMSQQQSRSEQNKPKSDKSTAAAVATGAAGIAAGMGAYAAYDHLKNDEIVDPEEVVDPVEDITGGTAGTAGAAGSHTGAGHTGATHTGGHAGSGTTTVPPVEPITPPVEPVTPPVEPVTPPVEPVTPPVEPVTPPVEPVTPPVEPVNPPVEPVEPPVEPIEPQIDVVENPDDIADAIIAGEEIDPNDLDAEGEFNFTEVETVYDINGNETIEARYIDSEGNTGTMVDLDGDGLFDQWMPDEGGIIVPANEGTFLTVSDAEADATEGYLAYDEETDPGLDEDISEDIIDTTDI